jgi:hypothetical protein
MIINKGGNKLSDFVNRNMEQLLTDEAALKITYRGQYGNYAFCETKYNSVMKGSLLNYKHNNLEK